MKFQTKNRTYFKKDEIEDILNFSKLENKKYLYQILSIKNISAFDASYIMNRLSLNDEKIKILNLALSKYENNSEINQSESYSDFLFKIVRNIEKLEKGNAKFLKEIYNCKNNHDNLKLLVNFLVEKSVNLFENTPEDPISKGFIFSKIYIDN